MEKFKILIFALLIGFTACENDEDRLYVKPADQVDKPVLSLDGANDIELTETTVDMVPAIISWTKVDFGADVLVEYTLEIASAESFEGAKAVPVGNNTYTKSLTAKELSDWAVNYFNGLDANGISVKTAFYLRIAAVIALENPSVTVPPVMLYSNSIRISVLPYYIPPAYPTEMYMIGKDFGNWVWEAGDIVEMTPVYGLDGHFWAIRYITAGNGFKWCGKKAWSGDFYSLGENIGFTVEDGNAFVATSGLYMIYMDMVSGKISIEEPKVYGIGDCFGGWNTATYPFSIAGGNQMSITTAAAGELRMYAASNIAPVGNDWWKMEFVIFDGIITYRGKGPDQNRVNVEAGKTVTLDFNAGTGKIE